MSWSGGAANRTWHRGRQLDGTEADEVLRVLDQFRREHGWEPGMDWNPFTGAYEWPQKLHDRNYTSVCVTAVTAGGFRRSNPLNPGDTPLSPAVTAVTETR